MSAEWGIGLFDWVKWPFGSTQEVQPVPQEVGANPPLELSVQIAKLDAIFERYRVWNDDLSLALHTWYIDMGEIEVEADRDHLPEERLRKQQMLCIDRLVRDILVDPIGRMAMMEEPMIDRRIDTNGVDQGWVWEASTAREYQIAANSTKSPFDQKEMCLKPHLFAKAMLEWVAQTVVLPKKSKVIRESGWLIVDIPEAITRRYQRQLDRQTDAMRADLVRFRKEFTVFLQRMERLAIQRIDAQDARSSERLSEAEEAHRRNVQSVTEQINRVERDWQLIRPSLQQAMGRSQAQELEILRIKAECERLAREVRQIH